MLCCVHAHVTCTYTYRAHIGMYVWKHPDHIEATIVWFLPYFSIWDTRCISKERLQLRMKSEKRGTFKSPQRITLGLNFRPFKMLSMNAMCIEIHPLFPSVIDTGIDIYPSQGVPRLKRRTKFGCHVISCLVLDLSFWVSKSPFSLHISGWSIWSPWLSPGWWLHGPLWGWRVLVHGPSLHHASGVQPDAAGRGWRSLWDVLFFCNQCIDR